MTSFVLSFQVVFSGIKAGGGPGIIRPARAGLEAFGWIKRKDGYALYA